MATTVHEAKVSAAVDCIRTHLGLVGEYYKSREEAIAEARRIVKLDGRLDDSQIAEAERKAGIENE